MNPFLLLILALAAANSSTPAAAQKQPRRQPLDDRGATFGAAFYGIIRNARATKVAPGELNYRIAKLQKDWLASGNAKPDEVQAWTKHCLEYQFTVDAKDLLERSAANKWTPAQNHAALLVLQKTWTDSKLATQAQVEAWSKAAFGGTD